MIAAVTARYRAAYAGLPREVWVLALVIFVNRSGSMVLPFLTLYLTSEIGMSEAVAGRLISVYGLGAVLGAYLGGRFSESYGAIRVQTIGLSAAVPLFLLIPYGRSWSEVAMLLFALSLCSEAVRPANAVATARLTGIDRRVQAFALQRLAANLGFSFGPAIGGFLATVDFRLLFIVDALTTLLAACILLGSFRLRAGDQSRRSAEYVRSSASPIRDAPYLIFLILLLGQALVFFQFASTYPLYLRDHFHLSKVQIGLMFAVNTVTIVLFEMLLVDVVKQWRLLKTIAWGGLFTCLGFGMLPFGETGLYCVLAMLITTVGEMLSAPLSSGFAANRSPSGSEGRYLAWFTMTMAAAAVIAPGLGAAVYQYQRDLLWIGCLAVGAVTVTGLMLLSAWIEQ